MKLLKKTAAIGSAVALILGIAATPAQAWTPGKSTCAIQEFFPFSSCNTGSVDANLDWHSVWFWFSGAGCPLEYRIRDTGNGVIVRSGVSWGFQGRVDGLYGRYRLELSRTGGIDCGGDGTIWNTF